MPQIGVYCTEDVVGATIGRPPKIEHFLDFPEGNKDGSPVAMQFWHKIAGRAMHAPTI